MDKFKYPIRIAIVDDDPTMTAKIEKIVSLDKRVSSIIFNDSSLALEFIIDQKVNFIISDVNMPKLNGDELLYKLKEMKHPVKAAIISSISNLTTAYRCFALGADVFVKPATSDIVESIVSGFIDRACKWNICVDKILSLKTREKNRNIEVEQKKKKFKLLLVDDDADIREYSSELLSGEFEIIEARNGVEALKKYDNVDLILLDINMPIMDGFQFLAKVEQDPNLNKPIIIVSGFVDKECKLEYSNVIAVVDKPFGIKELITLINETLED